jgi:hypothetical protein
MTAHKAFCCIDCGKCTLCSGEYYTVKNELWAASGVEPHGGMLCLFDLERRIGRALTAADFPVPEWLFTAGAVRRTAVS